MLLKKRADRQGLGLIAWTLTGVHAMNEDNGQASRLLKGEACERR